MKTTYSDNLVWCSLTKIKINEIEQIHLHSVVRLGKSLSLPLFDQVWGLC